MRARRLDDETVDRILAGRVNPVDAPPGYAPVVTLLAAARGAHDTGPVRIARPARAAARVRPRLPILAAAIVLGGASGAAYAAGLPAAASSTAHDVLRSLEGSSRPRAHEGSASSGAHRVTVKAAATTTATDAGTHRHRSPAAARRHPRKRHHGHGAAISALARSTTGTAGAKGAAISAAASGGKSHAGEHGHNGKSRASHGNGQGHGHGHGHGHGSGRPR
jgi:hypothetical protein